MWPQLSLFFRFLDRAAMTVGLKEDATGPINPWKLTTVTQVEEVKMLLKLFPIWLSTIIVWTALSQMETFSVEEGATMDHHMGRHFQFPPASLSVFELVNVLLILPLYDRFLVPFLRRYTGRPQGITQLQRIGTGIVFSILAMVVAGFVEVKRVNVARAHGLLDRPKVTVPISIFWLIPQYFLRGSTEIFTQIGQLEFFYGEAPDRMRSLGTAIYLSTIACGHFLSSVLVTVVNRVTSHGGRQPWLIDNLNRSRLDYFYWFLASLSFVNFLFFLLCAHFYRYKKVATFDINDITQRNNNILPNVEADV
jgi:peptide/histidine transporter 3/4